MDGGSVSVEPHVLGEPQAFRADIEDDGAAAPGARPHGVLQRRRRERFKRLRRLREFEHGRARLAKDRARRHIHAARGEDVGARRVDGHFNAILVGADPGRLRIIIKRAVYVLEHEAGRRFHGHDQHGGRLWRRW